MPFLCTFAGHSAGTAHGHNQGLDFAACHHCGCDLIRAEDGDWIAVPRGFRVVWREFGRSGDAASVAARMQHIAAPVRRRTRARPHRNHRGRPLKGAASVIGLFAGLGKLIEGGPEPDVPETDAGQYVIYLPGGG